MQSSNRIDIAESKRLQKQVRGQNKECYRNAVMAGVHLRDCGSGGWHYCEGWVAGGLLLIEHGWLQHDDGTIIDPTPIFIEDAEEGEIDRWYFPGFTWTCAEAAAAAVDAKTLPLQIDWMVPENLENIFLEAHRKHYGDDFHKQLIAWQMPRRRPTA